MPEIARRRRAPALKIVAERIRSSVVRSSSRFPADRQRRDATYPIEGSTTSLLGAVERADRAVSPRSSAATACAWRCGQLAMIRCGYCGTELPTRVRVARGEHIARGAPEVDAYRHLMRARRWWSWSKTASSAAAADAACRERRRMLHAEARSLRRADDADGARSVVSRATADRAVQSALTATQPERSGAGPARAYDLQQDHQPLGDDERGHEQIRSVARSPTHGGILGESGTARSWLPMRPRAVGARQAAVIAVDCGAIPDSLFESELFGHERARFGRHRGPQGSARACRRRNDLPRRDRRAAVPLQASCCACSRTPGLAVGARHRARST